MSVLQSPLPDLIRSTNTHKMSVAASVISLAGLRIVSTITASDPAPSPSCISSLVIPIKFTSPRPGRLLASCCTTRVSVDDATTATTDDQTTLKSIDDEQEDAAGDMSPELLRRARRSADWKAARAYNEKGVIYEGRVDGFNGGGLLIRFYSLVGFLPYPLLSPSHSCKEPNKTIQEIAKGLVGSTISLKVVQADEAKRRLIFSEKEAAWIKFSKAVKVGDVFDGKVGVVEDYGAFVHMCFPDGLYHLTGLVHVSEVSWDLVQDVRDVLSEGDLVRVKVVNIDSKKSRITLSIKQLEEDPLLETLDKVITQNDPSDPDSPSSDSDYKIEPLPGLEAIFEELRMEEGISDVIISRQGFEKRVVSPDLQLWLSNAPAVGSKFTLLARAGRQVQEIQLTTSLDQEGVKRTLQRVLERVP